MKDRNGKDLTEADDIKKRWQEYTEGLYEKGLYIPNKYDGAVTHLEPECKVWSKVGIRKHYSEQS